MNLNGLPLFDQLGERVLHDAGSPLVHFVLVVVYSSNETFDTQTVSRSNNINNIIGDEIAMINDTIKQL